MALPFENGNCFLTLGSVFRESFLENKTIIKSAYGDIYSMKYMGKTTDTFLWLKIRLPQTLSLRDKPKVMLQVEQTTLSY